MCSYLIGSFVFGKNGSALRNGIIEKHAYGRRVVIVVLAFFTDRIKATRNVPATITLIITRMITTLMAIISAPKVFLSAAEEDEVHQRKR
jgi:hypothetical protein